MRSTTLLAATATVLPTITATTILLPLYVYPSAVWGDGASNWQSLLTTVRSHRDDFFHLIINPDSGPAVPPFGQADRNYQDGVALLNAEPNVRTVAYVHTNYGAATAQEVIANVTSWKSWPAPYDLHGVFFDETPGRDGRVGNETAYMADLVAQTRAAGFNRPEDTIVFNVGKAVAEENQEGYFRDADIVIVYENSWAAYQAATPPVLQANIPAGRADQCNIMVHTFTGSLGQLGDVLRDISDARVNSTWFTSGDYATYTTPPANAENLAIALP